MNPTFFRIAKFLTTGAIGVSVNLATLALLVRVAGMHYLSASVIAISISTVVGFILQKYWTFEERTHARAPVQFALYAGLAVIDIGINTLIVYFLVEYLSLHYLLAQAIGAACIAVVSFVAYQLFIFKSPRIVEYT